MCALFKNVLLRITVMRLFFFGELWPFIEITVRTLAVQLVIPAVLSPLDNMRVNLFSVLPGFQWRVDIDLFSVRSEDTASQ